MQRVAAAVPTGPQVVALVAAVALAAKAGTSMSQGRSELQTLDQEVAGQGEVLVRLVDAVQRGS